ncbi:hypothetical protein T484DRAFT_2298524 [Baffinella frigidus]|nr:hypothetical protein T484DRAFT_2298524 [Cryptophyta sp. CCMP2293]
MCPSLGRATRPSVPCRPASILLALFFLLVTLSAAAEEPRESEASYVLEARVELPSNVSLAGAVGAKCLGVLRGWTRPAEIRRTISHGSLIDAFTHTASDRVHSWAESLAMGEVFSLDAAPILVILSQLHPGARSIPATHYAEPASRIAGTVSALQRYAREEAQANTWQGMKKRAGDSET